MKKRVLFVILFLLVIGVMGALTIFPEFCYFWQRTPVLKDIYAWVDGYFKPYIITATKSVYRDIYIAVIGSILATIFVFGFLKVKKVKPEEQKYIEVTATPIIDNKNAATVVVVEEK